MQCVPGFDNRLEHRPVERIELGRTREANLRDAVLAEGEGDAAFLSECLFHRPMVRLPAHAVQPLARGQPVAPRWIGRDQCARARARRA